MHNQIWLGNNISTCSFITIGLKEKCKYVGTRFNVRPMSTTGYPIGTLRLHRWILLLKLSPFKHQLSTSVVRFLNGACFF